MTAEPLVSVLIPLFNKREYVETTVRSALEQTYRSIEVIVIDDGSTDGSADVVRSIEDPRLRLIQRENRGANATRNELLSLAAGELVQYLDADDLIAPEKIARQVDAFRPDVDVVVCRVQVEDGGVAGDLMPPLDPADLLGSLAHHGVITVAPLYRREHLVAVGGWRDDLPASQEYELHLRLVLEQRWVHAVLIDEPLATYRRSPDSTSSDDERVYRAKAAALMGLMPAARQQERPYLAAALANAALHLGRYGATADAVASLQTALGAGEAVRAALPRGVRLLRAARAIIAADRAIDRLRRRRSLRPRTRIGQPLRVLWVVPDFPASRSDPSYVFLRLEAESLVRQPGVELRILTGSDRENDVPGLDIVRMRAPATVVQKVRLLARSLLRHPSLAVRAVRDRSRWYPALWRHDAVDHAIRAFGPAVVHSHFAFPDGSGAAELSHKHGARNVVTLRGVDTLVDWTIDYGFRLDPDYDKRYRSMLERADVITTATPEVREVAILAGARPSAVVVVPNAVTPPPPGSSPESGALRADLRLEPGALVALSVGRLVELKGFDVGVQALELLAASSDWHYVVIGEGDQRGRLEESALELGVADRLHLLGSIPHEHVWAWMAEADVYWFLSRVEAFGNVLLEAFFSGLPIVATRRGTAPALLADDPSSELISSLGPAELSEATNRVLASSEDRSRLRAARRPKRERFGAELRSTELIRLYRQS